MTKAEREFNEIIDSLLPELRADLERLDHRLRAITSEAMRFNITGELLEEKLRERFWGLAADVAGIKIG